MSDEGLHTRTNIINIINYNYNICRGLRTWVLQNSWNILGAIKVYVVKMLYEDGISRSIRRLKVGDKKLITISKFPLLPTILGIHIGKLEECFKQ